MANSAAMVALAVILLYPQKNLPVRYHFSPTG